MEWGSVAILVAQVVVAVVSYLTVYRHRVIYSISTEVLALSTGDPTDPYLPGPGHINEKLRSSKYTVLQVVERFDKSGLVIVLGQIKKQ